MGYFVASLIAGRSADGAPSRVHRTARGGAGRGCVWGRGCVLHLRADEQHGVNRHEVVDVEGLSFLLGEARGDGVVQRDLSRAAWVLR